MKIKTKNIIFPISMIGSIDPYSLKTWNYQNYSEILPNENGLNKEKVAKEKLQKLFKDDIKHKLAHIMERASWLIWSKEKVVYKTLKDILYRNPFDKWKYEILGKINTWKKVQP